MSNDLKTRLRIKFNCECGAIVLCKTRTVGQFKKCPACCKEFQVPHPVPPPHGDIWSIPYGLIGEEYKVYEMALTEYAAAIDAKERFPDLHDHIVRTLAVIRDFRNQYPEFAGGDFIEGLV